MAPAIGIDLGTTYSCVATWQYNNVEIIANDQGNRTTPSYVAFNETERMVGDAAKHQAPMNPENTLYDAKRLIGRRFDDPIVQEDIKQWPFKVINVNDSPVVCVQYKEDTLQLTPEEISSMILIKMKETAEAFLGEEVKSAVITVPAYFNDSQRQATKDAGTIAGLNVLRIINEPTAAALAYGFDKNLQGQKKILIFDLGGGTFDVSVVVIDAGSLFEVKSIAGNTHLGGEDFDNKLMEYLANLFDKKNNTNITTDARAVRRLKTEAERAKRTLSVSTQTTIEIPALYDGIDFNTKVSRARFEELCLDLFKNTLVEVEKALVDAEIDKDSLDDIILIGGSTRIPKIQSLLSEFFPNKQLNLSINPDEAVAYGAAVQAAILSGQENAKIQDILLVDVTPLSLGIETIGGLMSKIVDRNSQIPCQKTKMYTTVEDDQTMVPINVFEGERDLVKDNNRLGTFRLTGITPAPRAVPQIEVTFDLDANGILNVTAKDDSSGVSKNITIKNEKGRLSKKQIDLMVADADLYKEEDERLKGAIEVRNKLEAKVYELMNFVRSRNSNTSEADKERIASECNIANMWLEEHMSASRDEYESKLATLLQKCKIN